MHSARNTTGDPQIYYELSKYRFMFCPFIYLPLHTNTNDENLTLTAFTLSKNSSMFVSSFSNMSITTSSRFRVFFLCSNGNVQKFGQNIQFKIRAELYTVYN